MDFVDKLKQFANRAESMKENLVTEEATKMSLIVPFFQLLDYDVFNPNEFLPEFTADVGIKKGEKVDYAILKDGQPIILIEAKSCNEKLEKHDSQLFRYFGTTKAKFAILTNGLIYRFYTDLEEPNKMDEKPFLEIDILNLKEYHVSELKKFQKNNFDLDEIFSTASDLKYSNEFKNIFSTELQNPSDEFTKLFLSQVYSGVKTQNVIDKFKPVLKKSLNNYINELMNDKIKTALNQNNEIDVSNNTLVNNTNTASSDDNIPSTDIAEEKNTTKEIVTTNEELEAYFIIKNLLKEVVPMEDITYRDTVSYINILYKDNGRKWICRLILTDTQKQLLIPDEETGDNGRKNATKYQLENIYDLEKYKNELISVLKRFL